MALLVHSYQVESKFGMLVIYLESKLICGFNFHGFLRSVIGLENSRHHLNKKRRNNKINPLSFVAH